jgi:hypothetical protein
MAIPPKEAGQAYFSFPTIAVDTEVGLLVLDSAPQSLDQDIVIATLPSLQANLDLFHLQHGHEASRGEL